MRALNGFIMNRKPDVKTIFLSIVSSEKCICENDAINAFLIDCDEKKKEEQDKYQSDFMTTANMFQVYVFREEKQEKCEKVRQNSRKYKKVCKG